MRGPVICVPCVLVQVIGRFAVDILVLTAFTRRWGCSLQLVGHPTCIDYAVHWVVKNIRLLLCQKYLFDFWWVGMGVVKG